MTAARIKSLAPWAATVATVAASMLLLRAAGRLPVCSCGHFRLWTGEAWGAETSQQLFDPYSLTHVLHGFALCGLVALAAPRALSAGWRFFLAVAAESLWEVVENSEFVIRRYREATAALGYEGDTVVNSVGDIVACGLGFLISRRLGLWRTLALFAAVEALLLVWVRDSLLLNVLMLFYPLDFIKTWQAGL